MDEDIGSFAIDLVDKYLGVEVDRLGTVVKKVLVVGGRQLAVVDFGRGQVKNCLLGAKHTEEVDYSGYVFPRAL